MNTRKASLQEKENGKLAENAARAPFFLVFKDKLFIKSLQNPFIYVANAGIVVADFLKQENCQHFVAEKIGENMKSRLKEHGISYEATSGT